MSQLVIYLRALELYLTIISVLRLVLLTGILLLINNFFLTRSQLSSLELICRQNEDVIKKREEAVKELQSELDRQAQIAAMIHNLSSGKVPISNYRANAS